MYSQCNIIVCTRRLEDIITFMSSVMYPIISVTTGSAIYISCIILDYGNT